MLSRTQRVKYLAGALTAVCELMRSYGISKRTAEREFRDALKRGYSVGKLRPSREVRPITRLAEVFGRWYIDKKYLERNGLPKPLTWNGKKGTLFDLVRLVVGRDSAGQVVEELFARRLLRKSATGGWIPKSRVVAPSGIDSAQVLRTATMIERFLRTIAYNSDLKYRGEVLLEVMAHVPRLPARDISRFRKFSKAQGLIFAKTVDDWLESRTLHRSSKKRGRTREAGIVAFAFEQPSNS